MSNLQLDENKSVNLIKAYAPGRLIIQDTTYTESLIITPLRVMPQFEPQTFEALSADHLLIMLTIKPSILIIGTGEFMHYLPPEYYGELLNRGIGVEFMSTSAACRTYNALASENRNVAAALVIR